MTLIAWALLALLVGMTAFALWVLYLLGRMFQR